MRHPPLLTHATPPPYEYASERLAHRPHGRTALTDDARVHRLPRIGFRQQRPSSTRRKRLQPARAISAARTAARGWCACACAWLAGRAHVHACMQIRREAAPCPLLRAKHPTRGIRAHGYCAASTGVLPHTTHLLSLRRADPITRVLFADPFQRPSADPLRARVRRAC